MKPGQLKWCKQNKIQDSFEITLQTHKKKTHHPLIFYSGFHTAPTFQPFRVECFPSPVVFKRAAKPESNISNHICVHYFTILLTAPSSQPQGARPKLTAIAEEARLWFPFRRNNCDCNWSLTWKKRWKNTENNFSKFETKHIRKCWRRILLQHCTANDNSTIINKPQSSLSLLSCQSFCSLVRRLEKEAPRAAGSQRSSFV